MNRLVTYLFLFSITSALHGMGNDLVITKPYQAPFSMRHKAKIDNVKAGAVALLSGGVAFAGQKYLGLPISTELHMTIPLSSFAAAVLWQKYQEKKSPGQLIDLLLTNPQAVLDYMDSVAPELHSKFDETPYHDIIQKHDQNKDVYAQRCPVFLLEECQSKYCPFTRKNAPHLRTQFADRVQRALLEKLENKADKQPVRYASFGSGGLFQDLVILTNVLAKKPDATMQVHLIDLRYKICKAVHKWTKNTSKIDTNSHCTMPERSPKFFAYLYGILTGSEQDTDEQRYTAIRDIYIILQTRTIQLVRWLHTTFPESRLVCRYHHTTDDYLKYVKKTHNNPDVIAAIDIQDDMSRMNDASHKYATLCKDALELNSSLTNIALLLDQEGPAFESVSLVQVPNSRPFPDGEAYYTIEPLKKPFNC